MSVKYSPLCDGDLTAYLAYCYASHGSGVIRSRAIGGIGGDEGCDGRGDDYVGDVDVDVDHYVGAWSAWLASAGVRGGAARVCGTGGCCVAGGQVQSGVGRFSGPCVGNGCSGLVGGAVVKGIVDGDADSDGSSHEEDGRRMAEAVPVGSVVSGSDVVRKVGKWRRKNQKKKEKRERERKETESRESSGSEVFPEETMAAVPGGGGGAFRGRATDLNWRKNGSDQLEKSEARRTLEEKWVIENKLKVAEAKRKLQLLEMQDVIEVAKLQERKMKAAGERAMVQIEKSHATLAATGNVPGVVPKGGYCTTVMDDPGLSDGSSPSCTISPDSSASMHEFRECQRKLADSEKENADLKKLLSRREKAGRMNREESVAEFTVNGSEVGLPASLCEVLDEKCGQYEYEGLCDGKHIVRAVHDLHFGFEEGEDVIGAFDIY